MKEVKTLSETVFPVVPWFLVSWFFARQGKALSALPLASLARLQSCTATVLHKIFCWSKKWKRFLKQCFLLCSDSYLANFLQDKGKPCLLCHWLQSCTATVLHKIFCWSKKWKRFLKQCFLLCPDSYLVDFLQDKAKRCLLCHWLQSCT